VERSAANMPRNRVQRTARHDARGLGTDKAASPRIQRASRRAVKDAKEERCTRGDYQGVEDSCGEDKRVEEDIFVRGRQCSRGREC